MQSQSSSTSKFCPGCGAQNPSYAGFCYSCGSSLPTSPPVQTPQKKKISTPALVGICSLIGFFVLSMTLISIVPGNRLASKETPSNFTSTDLSLAPSAHRATPSAWRYDSDVDEMSGKKSQTARVKSSNTVNFDFPYQGAQHGTLTLRKHPRWGKNVMFEIEHGQFMAGVTGVQVLVRFDDGAPVKFLASGPEDHSTAILFIRDYGRFVAQLRKTKTVRLSTSVYQQGSPVFEFEVGGLEGF